MTEVGKALYDIAFKSQEKISAIDLQRSVGKKVAKDIEETLERHKDLQSPYYIKLILRRHRLLPRNHLHYQVVAPYFEKPSPEYDTSVFRVENKNGDFKFLWSIPDEETCTYLLAHENDLPKSEQELLGFVKQFANGTLS